MKNTTYTSITDVSTGHYAVNYIFFKYPFRVMDEMFR